jgi:hypothetical protein
MAALRRLRSPRIGSFPASPANGDRGGSQGFIVCVEAIVEAGMQQGRGGIGSRKHGVSGHATQSPRLRLGKKLAADRGEYDVAPARRQKRLEFETVQQALQARRKPR